MNHRDLFVLLLSSLACLAGATAWSQNSGLQNPAAENGSQAQTLTFSKDIAPIIFNHCAVCHRPGQSAPFTLLNYREVSKHAKQIAEVTQRRYMPPWLPEPGYGDFAGERRLTVTQIEAI